MHRAAGQVVGGRPDRSSGDLTPASPLCREAATTFHPSSTCQMGPACDPTGVVDAAGCVHGQSGLRVVDASVCLWGPRGNLHGQVIAAAEKLADVMRTSA